MMKNEFYKMDFNSWDEGTTDLTLEQEAAYLRLCHQMYRSHGPILNSIRLLCSLWRCHQNKARKLLADLIACGKVSVTSDGCLANNRVRQELDTRETTSRHRADAGYTGGIRSGHSRRNTLKEQDGEQAIASAERTRGEERRGEERRSSATGKNPYDEATDLCTAALPADVTWPVKVDPDISPVMRALGVDGDLRRDGIPVICERSLQALARNDRIKRWTFFEDAIRDRVAARKRGQAALIPKSQAITAEQWDAAFSNFVKSPKHDRMWPGGFGAPPDDPECEAPADIMQKHGFAKEAA